MSASACPDLKFAKGKPRLIEKRETKSAETAKDNAERKICHLRSGGRCEVQIVTPKPEQSLIETVRCKGKAVHNHHLISGTGKRNVGRSIMSRHRLDMCAVHHQELHANVIVIDNLDHKDDALKVRFRKVQF